jgi:dTMP kinase
VVFTTREPGGTAISDQVRQILMAMKNTTMHPRTELLLFLSARASWWKRLFVRGWLPVRSLFLTATVIPPWHTRLRARIRPRDDPPAAGICTGGLKPDLTLLLDIDARRPAQAPIRRG